MPWKWLSISRAPTTHRICDWGSSSWWTFRWSALLKSDLTWSILVLSPRKIIFETQFSTFTVFFSQLVVTDFCKWRRLSLVVHTIATYCYLIPPLLIMNLFRHGIRQGILLGVNSSSKYNLSHIWAVQSRLLFQSIPWCFFILHLPISSNLFCIFQKWEVSWVYSMILIF